MTTANVTINACAGASDSMKVYYGKTLLVTGDPVSGTGWTLYTGGPIAGSTTSVTITGLDDNVEYTFYRYCHCPVSGDTTPEIDGPIIKYVCPSFQTTNASSNQIDYVVSVPPSVNNSGTWIQRILVEVYDSTGTTLLSQNVYNGPFSSTLSGSFLGLLSQTSYQLRIRYSNTAGTLFRACTALNIDTTPACVAPTVNISNLNGTSFDINWTVPSAYIGDTYNIIINSSTVASSIPYGSQPYTYSGATPSTSYSVQVVRNFAYGGQCTSSTQTVNTPFALISGVLNLACNSNCSSQGDVILSINFTAPTPVPLTLYFGKIEVLPGNPAVGSAYGYDLFAIPPGITPAPGSGSNFPYFINVPSGTSNLNVTGPFPRTDSFAPWVCQQCQGLLRDVYVKIQAPSGYASNFSKGIGNLYHASAVVHNV